MTRNDPAGEPAAPYDHSGFSEESAATETIVAGQAGTVTQGLKGHGYWCVQPRSNDLAVQINCQSPTRDVQVALVTEPDGDILYGHIDLEPTTAPAPSQRVGDRLGEVLDSSFLQLWPQDRASVQNLVEDAQPSTLMPFGRPAPPAKAAAEHSTHHRRTADATWSLDARSTGEPLGMRVRTKDMKDQSWPFEGRHYATGVNAATTELIADGFTCSTSCHRGSDGQTVDFDEHDGRIVAVRFTLRSSAEEGDRPTDPSGQWVRAGLPFLTPAVQAAVGQRVEESRIQQRSWRGVISGTPIDIDAVSGAALMPNDRPAKDLMVTIGIPLLVME